MNEKNDNLSVSGLVSLIQEVVETNFVTVAVEGEVSNFAAPASGHWYFTLKDSGAQLRAVMFRGRNRLMDGRPEDGMQVVCSGTVTIYPARGEMQMVVDRLVPTGSGLLQAAFERLKAELAAEGLFGDEHKQAIPAFPRCVGIVTSGTGAAVHDILNVLKRRAPGLQILIRPVRVQGEGAAEEIAAGIEALNHHGGPDVIIVGRGGGSLEDLWAFNEDVVARAIFNSSIPVISAVGQEVDVTIADFVADLRAPTPSAAAELVARSRMDLENHLDHLSMRLGGRLQQVVSLGQERAENLSARLVRAKSLLDRQRETLDGLASDLERAARGQLKQQVDALGQLAGRLDALSPLKQLERGYAIASRQRDGVGLTRVDDLSLDESLWLRLAAGRLRARIEEIES